MWMPRYIRMRFDLAQIAREQRKIDTSPPLDENDAYDRNRTYDSYYEWRQLVLTRYWEDKAASLGVELPDWSDKSLRGQVDFDNDESQPWYLTPAGINQIRSAVREEQKYRREVRAYWIASFVGVIGALTGLVSVLKGS